jgi:hypothetical protein
MNYKTIENYTLENYTEYLKDFLDSYYLYDFKKTFTKEELENQIYDCDIYDDIRSYSDSQVDIYDSDLLERLKNNHNLYNEAIKEFGNSDDLIKNIMTAQYYNIYNIIREELEEFFNYFDLENNL